MNTRLIKVVPALAAMYAEWAEIHDDEPVGPHVAYGMLAAHLVNLLRDDGHEAELTRIFRFIEELALHPDEDIVNVIHVSVLEALLDSLSGEELRRAVRLMRPATREIARQQAEMFRHADEIRGLLRESKR